MRSGRGWRRAIPLALAWVVAAGAASAADPQAIRQGYDLLAANCASCHAIGRTGPSPHPQAMPFRDLHLHYDVDNLSEALVEGFVSGHPDMPEFRFQPAEAQAIIGYLKTLEAE